MSVEKLICLIKKDKQEFRAFILANDCKIISKKSMPRTSFSGEPRFDKETTWTCRDGISYIKPSDYE